MTNSLADVAGVRVGHAERVGDGWRTGVTLVLPGVEGAVAGVDVRGAAPGTRETDLLDPRALVERAHAVALCGGSAFGLAAATGVMDRLGDAGRGVVVKPGIVVPIVPAAVIFDLGRGGDPRATPEAALGAAAYDACHGGPVGQGSVGAGAGAQAGGLAGGVGSASVVLGPSHQSAGGAGDETVRESPRRQRTLPDRPLAGDVTVAALAVVNAAGSPVDRATGELHAVRHGLPGEFDVRAPDPAEAEAWQTRSRRPGEGSPPGDPSGLFNTVIGVVATDAGLTKAQCSRLASAAHDGLARAVRPCHTMTDGDTVFGLATGSEAPDLAVLDELLAAAADTFARAIGHAMLAATGRPGAPAYRDVFPSALTRPG